MTKKTWILADNPEDVPIVKNKWVFVMKKNKDGNIDRYKSRLVAMRCSQRYGVNYKETFSVVVRFTTVRIVLAIAVELKMIVHQLDVTTAYLNADIDVDIYMQQPEGFVDAKNPDKVCKLQKAIYGLKQSGRRWNEKFNEIVLDIGFILSKVDRCAYTMHDVEDYVIM